MNKYITVYENDTKDTYLHQCQAEDNEQAVEISKVHVDHKFGQEHRFSLILVVIDKPIECITTPIFTRKELYA